MIRQILKLVWNRKWKSALLIAEIFISFLALFVVMLTVLKFTHNADKPLGFDYQNVWRVDFQTDGSLLDANAAPMIWETVRELEREVRQMPEVESTAKACFVPYTDNVYCRMECDGGNLVDGSFAEVLRIPVKEGRWFSAADDAVDYTPIVINEKLARECFGNESPLGKRVRQQDLKDDLRVVGVLADFRQNGEYSSPQSYVFFHMSERRASDDMPRSLLIRTRTKEGDAFAERLSSRLHAVAANWKFDIEPLTATRNKYLKAERVPIMVGGLVVGFLLVMVGLGLTGVQWQNVTRRIPELGLRRASGATAGKVAWQVVCEALVLTSFAILMGVLVVAQLPMLDLLGFFTPAVYALAMILSAVVIYMLTLGAALYPGWLATRILPADALRYE